MAAIIFFLLLLIFSRFELFVWLAYQHYPVASAGGLSYPAVIVLAELFAVISKAILLRLYGKFSWKFASWLGLVMNVTSFVMGLVVFSQLVFLISHKTSEWFQAH